MGPMPPPPELVCVRCQRLECEQDPMWKKGWQAALEAARRELQALPRTLPDAGSGDPGSIVHAGPLEFFVDAKRVESILDRLVKNSFDLDERIERIYTHADRLMRAARWDELEATLRAVDVASLDPTELLAWLSITMPAKSRLATRAKLVRRIRERLTREEPEWVGALLEGLE
jgi:hypothetical protein